MRLTLGEIATATGGTLAGPAELAIDAVVTDSRRAGPGGLFVALDAERDGHEFVADARARGAAAVLVSQPVGEPAVLVADTLAALGDLGRHARDRLERAVVAGITGSTGKTSTKDLLAGALGAAMETVASEASFNNEIGAPLTLLRAADTTEAVVVEMGARGIGHIAYLAGIARPTAGIITNIGVAHAELFGTLEETAKAKGELLEALPTTGYAVLNADDAKTPGLAARTSATVIQAGRAPTAEVRIITVDVDDELHPTVAFATPWGAGRARLPLRGAHQAGNAALALALAGSVGVPLETALAGLESATPSPLRMELVRTPGGVLVLNDAYNANPTSMRAALDAFAHAPVPGRRFAVLGFMAELGPLTDIELRRAGEHAVASRIDVLVVVGDAAEPMAEAAQGAASEGSTTVVRVENPERAAAWLRSNVESGDAVLVKASRAARLETVAAALAGGRGPGVRA